jgi:hypothetical protein
MTGPRSNHFQTGARIIALGFLWLGACDTKGAEAGADTDTSTTGEPLGPPMYCPDVPEWPDPVCRVVEDCEHPYTSCVSAPEACWGPGNCPYDCDVDAQCVDWFGPGMNGVCVKGEGCCSNESYCAAPCTDGSCAATDTCQLDGHCTPTACDAGYTCPEGFSCELGQPGSDGHGCRVIPCDEVGALACPLVHTCVDGACQRLACVQDDDCPCGTCMQAQCWDRPWVCYSDYR